jgi:hypothetical protein
MITRSPFTTARENRAEAIRQRDYARAFLTRGFPATARACRQIMRLHALNMTAALRAAALRRAA